MAGVGKRYKAGTIFLDVVPSFRGVQDKIKSEVQKYNKDLLKDAEKHGEKAGEAEAKARVKAAEKVDSAARAEKVRAEKAANKAFVADEIKSVAKIVEESDQLREQAHQKQIDRLREEGRIAGEVDEKYREEADKADAKARKRRSDEIQAERLAEFKAREELRKAEDQEREKEHQAELERKRKEFEYERDFQKLLADERKKYEQDREQAYRDHAKWTEKMLNEAYRLNDTWDRNYEQARERAYAMHATFLENEAKAEKDARKDKLAAEEKLGREIMAINRRAQEEADKLEREGAKEREKLVMNSGGMIGRELRKRFAEAAKALPDLDLDLDMAPAERKLVELRKQMDAFGDKQIGVDISLGESRTQLAQMRKELSSIARRHTGSIEINALAALAQLEKADDEIDRVKANAQRPTIMRIFVRYIQGRKPDDGSRLGHSSAEDGANAFRIFNPLVAIAAILLAALGPAAAVAGAGIMALAGTLVAAAAGVGVLTLAFGGLFKAIQDQIKLSDEQGRADGTAAKQRVAAARQVRDAKERLADAETQTARATEDAARRVSDAEESLADARRQAAQDIADAAERQRDAEQRVADAQKDAEDAQRGLNEARREAKRDLEDLNLAYADAKLDEKEAQNQILQAQERLNEVRRRAWKGDASSADVRAAEIDVDQARLRARKSTVDRRRAGEDNTRAQAAGVEGSEKVQNAKDRLESALDNQRDAQRDLAKATQNVARVRVAAARSVAKAEQGVSDALRDQARVAQDNARTMRDARQGLADAQQALAESGSEASTAAKNAKQSMDALHPSAQRFALFILSLRDDLKQLRGLAAAGVFPGLEAGMRELSIYGPGMRKFTSDMGKMWGDTFRMIGKEMTGPTWRSFFATMGKDGPKQAGLFNKSLMNVTTTIVALVDAFSPLTTDFLVGLEKLTAKSAGWAASLKGSPAFERFLAYVERVAPIVGNFFWEMGRAIGHVAIALAPLGEGILKLLTSAFEKISETDPAVIEKIATAIVAVFIAMQLAAGAGTLFTALTNPFTSMLSAIAFFAVGAVVALVYFYQTNDTAREYIDRFLGVLKDLGKWMLDNIGTIAKVAGVFAGLFAIYKLVKIFMMVRRAAMMLGLTLKLTFLLNPYVLAIAALIGAVVYLWKTNESFRDAVKTAWGAIKQAMKAVADWWTETAAPAIGKAFTWLGENVVPILTTALDWLGKAVTWLWENVVHPYLGLMVRYWKIVFSAIASVAKWLWNDILKPVFTELVAWWNDIIAPALTWLWKNVFAPAFTAIGKAAKALWEDFLHPAFQLIVHFVKTFLGPVLSWLWESVISPVFGWIGDKIGGTVTKKILPHFRLIRDFLKKVLGPSIKWLWDKVAKPTFGWIGDKIAWLWKKSRPNFDKMAAGVDALRKGFVKAKEGIGKAWDGLKETIAKPIRAALKFIQTNFIDKVNSLLKSAGLELRIPRVWSGDPTPKKPKKPANVAMGTWRGLATGGILPGYTPMARGDDRLVPMRSGEGVLVSEGLRDDRSRSMFLAANEAAKRGVSFANFFGGGYAKGGIVELGKRIQKMGYHVSEHPAFGGVVPGAHAANGWHYKGGALDINADPFNSTFKNEAAALDRLNAMLRSEGWNTIWRAANHYDHLHVDIANGQKGALDGIVSGIADKALSFVTKGAKSVIGKIPGDNIFSEMSKGLLTKMLSGFESKISDEASMVDMGEAKGMSGKSVERWRPMVLKALGILGLDKKYANVTLRQIGTESGGNPRAINLDDINAKRGTPSKGLLQVIDPTYRAYAHPQYNKGVYDPLSNILASMRYAISRYGNLFNAYRGVGYATGTDSATAGWHLVGEDGPELMRFRGGEQVYNRQQTLRLAELSAQSRGGFSGTVLVQNPWTGKYHEAKMQQIVDNDRGFHESVSRMRK